MTFDSTMNFRTNMSRAEIDAKLPELITFAQAAQLTEVVKLLSNPAGVPNAELESRMNRCLEILGGADEYALLIDQLDMLVINLRNQK
jgi:hypothetical protein